MSKETTDFLNKHANDVIQSIQGTGLFPSLKMAQMIIESSGKDAKGKFVIGQGLAVRKARNYFGIKADKSWNGKSVALSTPKDGKPVSLFRVYPSALESLQDHSQFLLKNSRYQKNGVFIAKTPQGQAQALQRSGYSESPTYGKTLIGIISAYRLEALDGQKPTSNSAYYFVGGGVVLALGSLYLHNKAKTTVKK